MSADFGEGSESGRVASILSKAYASYVSAGEASVSTEDADELRKAYLAIIERETWRKEFKDVARQLAQAASQIHQDDSPGEESEVSHPSATMTFCLEQQVVEIKNRLVILVGRQPRCDLRTQSSQTSRVHAIVFLLPATRSFLVVDVGGRTGIYTKARSSSTLPRVHSLPHQRNVLVFEEGETAVLKIANVDLTINPKDCVICLDRKRQVVFSCRHFVACHICSEHLTRCPICRAAIARREEFPGASSLIPSSS